MVVIQDFQFFQFDSGNWWSVGSRDMTFCVVIDYKHSYKFCMNIVFESTLMNMTMVQDFEEIH
jgi:hypothetical protein